MGPIPVCNARAGTAGVASGHALATEAGIKALRLGGSAVDAALASAFTQWVVNAPQCGPGGELVALVAAPGTGDGAGEDFVGEDFGGGDVVGGGITVYGGWSNAPLALAPSGTSEPSGAPAETNSRGNSGSGANSGNSDSGGRSDSGGGGTDSRGGGPLDSAFGPRNAVVPGALRGAEAAWNEHGKLSWASLFEGALAAASGHAVTPRMAEVYGLVQDRGHTEALERILGSRRAPDAGAVIRMPRLASTLERVASQGADVFYTGGLAEELVAAAASDGAALSLDDLAAVRASIEPARRFELDDVVMWVTPAPSQAAIVAALLNAVPADADPAARSFAEAVAPLTELQLTEFCVDGPGPGPGRRHGTAVSTAVDRSGLSVTVVHSLAEVQFGTGWVAGDTGVAFSNRVGTALSQRADLPGCNPVPGGVLPHTLSAAHVRRRGSAGWVTLATPGGDRQVQWLAQAIQRFRRGGDAAEIAAGPRWFVCPSGDRFGVPAGIGEPWYAFAEPGIAWHNDDEVAGYEVRRVENVGGGLQLTLSDSAADNNGGVTLASDPRSGGAAQSV